LPEKQNEGDRAYATCRGSYNRGASAVSISGAETRSYGKHHAPLLAVHTQTLLMFQYTALFSIHDSRSDMTLSPTCTLALHRSEKPRVYFLSGKRSPLSVFGNDKPWLVWYTSRRGLSALRVSADISQSSVVGGPHRATDPRDEC
jgi:hypothetical protein